MPIIAKNIVVKNNDGAHLKPKEEKKPEVPKPVEKAQPIPQQTEQKEVSTGLFAKKKSKFLDDMLNSN
jgi:hypothetical protein